MRNPLRQQNANARRVAEQGCVKPDARIALTAVLVYSVALFWVDGWAWLAVLAVVLVAFAALLRPPMRTILIGLVPLYLILGFTVIAHIPQGLTVGLFFALRIFLLAIATLMVAFAYDDARLVRAISSMLSPLRALHVPTDDVATMFSIALRFIPASLDEIARVQTAQMSRGARFEQGGIADRVKCWSMVLIPVIVGMFRRAETLACAMDARCYSGGKRTSLHADALRPMDFILLAIGVTVCVGTAVLA